MEVFTRAHRNETSFFPIFISVFRTEMKIRFGGCKACERKRHGSNPKGKYVSNIKTITSYHDAVMCVG